MIEQHEMILKEEYEDGSQLYVCPVCNRSFILSWPPNYKKELIEEGNKNAQHSGGTVQGLELSASFREDNAGDLDDPYLDIWEQFVDKL